MFTRIVCLLAASVCVAFCSAAKATVLVDSNGFEAPNFGAGDVSGQDGWLTVGGGASTATIQSTDVISGSQSLRVDRASGSNRFWLQQLASGPSGRFVSIDWDMAVEQTPVSAGFGPFIGVQTFDDSSGGVLQSAGLGVDSSTGDILYQAGGSGSLTDSGLVIEFDQAAHFRIDIDFETDTYSAFVDEFVVVSDEGFIDGSSINSLSDADIVALGAGADAASIANPGVGFFDNFVVRDGPRGDYNSDGFVDAADYTVWRDSLGQTGFGLDADGDADGAITETDYDIWVENFGVSNALSGTTAVGVPEPTAAVLAAAAAALAIALGRRQP